MNEPQEASPSPRKPAAGATVRVGKRECQRDVFLEYAYNQAACDAVLTDAEDTTAAPGPTITPAELKRLRRLLAEEGGAGTAGKRGDNGVTPRRPIGGACRRLGGDCVVSSGSILQQPCVVAAAYGGPIERSMGTAAH